MVKWLKNRKWVLTSLFLVAVLLGLSGIQVVDRTALDNRVGIGIGNEKVITLGHIAYAAGSVDYTYDGVDDDIQFQLALAALPITGGRLVDVSAVQKNFSATVTRAIPNVTIDGSGAGSYFVNDGVTALFTAGGNNWKFENLRTDAGSINMGATTEWMWTNVTVNVTYYAYNSPYGQSAFDNADVGTTLGVGNIDITDSGADDRLLIDTYAIPRTATFTVAASDASAQSLAQADYVCDGVADGVEINAALTATTALGGGQVSLSEGTFNIATAINLRNNTLSGVGYQTVLKCTDATAINVIEYTCVDEDRPVVENLSIDGNKAAQADGGDENNQNGIYVVSDTHIHPRITFHDLYIDACKKNGIRSRHTSANAGQGHLIMYSVWSMWNGSNGLSMYWCEDTVIIGSEFGGNGECGILGVGLYEVVIDSCMIEGNGLDIVKSGANLNGAYITVSDCIIEGNRHSGIYLNANSSTISNNHFKGNGLWGILVGGTNHNNVIEGNRINENSATTPNTNAGIRLLDDSHDNIVIGNLVTGSDHKYALEIRAGVYGTIVSGNRLKDATTANLYVNAGAYNNVIYNRYADIFMDVLVVSATHVRSNEDLSAGVPITFTLDAQPDVPRTLSGHFDAHAQITAYTIEILGVDGKGNTLTETMTEADLWDWETDNAFATITSITMTARTGTGVGDTMDIGVTDVLGLSNVIYETADVYKIKKNTANATVAVAQVDADYDTYDMSVITLAATDDFTIWYRSNLNIIN